MRSAENVELELIVNLEYAYKWNWLIMRVEEPFKKCWKFDSFAGRLISVEHPNYPHSNSFWSKQ
jgi:hypothetical protein